MLIIPYEKNIFCFQKAQWKARGLERPSEGGGSRDYGGGLQPDLQEARWICPGPQKD